MARAITKASDKLHQNGTLPRPASRLTPEQVRALAALLSGSSYTVAADQAGVARSTLYRWMNKTANFISEYITGLKELADARRQRVRLLGVEAVELFRRLMWSRKTPIAVRARLAVEMVRINESLPDAPTDPVEIRQAI